RRSVVGRGVNTRPGAVSSFSWQNVVFISSCRDRLGRTRTARAGTVSRRRGSTAGCGGSRCAAAAADSDGKRRGGHGTGRAHGRQYGVGAGLVHEGGRARPRELRARAAGKLGTPD